MRTVTVKKRDINTAPLDDWIVEDSHDFDEIDFRVDESVDGLKLFLIFRNNDDEGGVEELDGTVWRPSHRFTAISGQMSIQLIAVDGETYSQESDVRWSSRYATINIQRNIEAEELVDDPEQSMIEDIICGSLE